ncbi:MAG: glycerate kinase [Candidatus Bathyarchaeota archaeon]|jgi:glycerate-2-kinase
MLFRNRETLLENAASEPLRRLREDALDIMEDALRAVDPGEAVRRNMGLKDPVLTVKGRTWDLNELQNIYIIGGGKACGAMAGATKEILGERITSGAVNVLKGTEGRYKLGKIRVNGASHPVPDKTGVQGVEKMLALLDGAGDADLVIVLISGGGSSLLVYPDREVSLGDIRDVTSDLLMSGATIGEINAVRKHLSAVKGGLLAKRAYPATVVSLILSDVVGDPLDTIASGPTSPDNTSFNDAFHVLKRYRLWESAPQAVRRRIESGLKGDVQETPKEGDPIFEKVSNYIIGNNREAALAALDKASALGYNSLLLSTQIEGEAREVGKVLGGIACEALDSGNPVRPRAALILGGETTVIVKGDGIGGRNQETALAASLKINGLEAILITLATDGIDGPTEAAGALVDGATLRRARREGLNPLEYLDENDSFSFFNQLGDALVTGPTGTNVNDLNLILVGDS